MAILAPITTSASKLALTGMVLLAFLAGGFGAFARESGGWGGKGADRLSQQSSIAPAELPESSIALAKLPAQGQQTYGAILRGGPFGHDKDGSVFGNRERQLPRERRGHYREYTVETPGAHDRGARRIVCGGQRTAPRDCWYTADHYTSFKRILP